MSRYSMARYVSLFVILSMILSAIPLTLGAATAPLEVKEEVEVIPDELDTSQIVMTFDRPIIEVVDGETIVSSPEMPQLYDPLRPDLPRGDIKLEFEVDFRLVDVVVEPGPVEEMELEAPVRLIPEPMAIGFNGPMHMDEHDIAPYEGWMFPETWGKHYIGRGLNDNDDPTVFLTLLAYPVRVEGDALFFTKEVTFTFTHYKVEEPSPGTTNRDLPDEEYKLLIIGVSSLSGPINDLVAHKKALGLTTKFVTTADIYNGVYFSVQGSDNPEKIKYFIKDAADNWDTRFVLLFGDVGQVPPFYVPYSDAYGSTVPTDLYYADIYGATGSFSDWDDAQGSTGSYTMPDDLYLDVHIGRLPADTITEANTVVDKVIHYENDTDKGSWFKTAVLIGTDPFSGGSAEGEIGMDFISDVIDDDFTNIKKLYSSNTTATPAHITPAINAGAGIVTYAGHGHITYLAIGGGYSYSTSHVSSTTNGYKLGIGSQAACLTGYYDGGSTSYSEYWLLKNGGGGIANMGASRVAYGSWGNSWPYAVAGAMNNRLYSSLVSGKLTAGSMYTGAHTNYMNTIGVNSGTDFKTVIEFAWFADPSMVIGVSVDATIEDPPLLIPDKDNSFNVTITNDGLLDLPVSLTTDDAAIPEGWTMQFIPATINVQAGSDGKIRVVVKPDKHSSVDEIFTIPLQVEAPSIERVVLTENVDLRVAQVFDMRLESDYPVVGRSLEPGEEMDIEFTVHNEGNGQELIDLELQGIPEGWDVTIESDTTLLNCAENKTMTISVKVPDQSPPATESILLKGQVNGHPDKEDEKLFNIKVRTLHDWDLKSISEDQVMDQGTTATYQLEFVNNGNVPETLQLEIDGPPRWTLTYEDEVTIDPYSDITVQVYVMVPEFEYVGNYTLDLAIENKGTAESETGEMGLDINPSPEFDLTALDEVIQLAYMEGGEVTLFMENTGNTPMDISIEVTEVPEDWSFELDVTNVHVSAQESTHATLFVGNPEFTIAGNYTVGITASAIYDRFVLTDVAEISVQVDSFRDTKAMVEVTDFTVDPGGSLTVQLELENNGNAPETFTDIHAMIPDGWEIGIPESECLLAPFSEETMDIEVTVSETALTGMYRITLFAKNEASNHVFSIGVKVNQIFGFESSVQRTLVTMMPGKVEYVLLNLSNLGNGEDTMGIQIEGTLWTMIDRSTLSLGAGAMGSVRLTISPSKDVKPGDYPVTLKVRSEDGKEEVHTIVVTVKPLPQTFMGGDGNGLWAMMSIMAVIAVMCLAAALILHRRKVKRLGDPSMEAVPSVSEYRSFQPREEAPDVRGISLIDLDDFPDYPDGPEEGLF